MKKTTTLLTLCLGLVTAAVFAQPTPEVLHYKFDGTGTTVPNMASAPPAGTATATIMGSITQGAGGQCGGALIGSGNASSTDYLNTGYAPNLTGSWTISMYTKDITASSTLFYIFGDANSGSFRCFTNGVAMANNWVLRGPITDVYVYGGATVAPHVTTFVYDQAAGNIKAYLDGVLVNTVAQASATIVGTGPFKVMGYGTNVGSPAGGKLDEFRMYSRALAASEVAELMYIHTTSTLTAMACINYSSPAGNTYTTSGTYMDTIPNSTGCDSIITINLTVNQPSSSTMSVTACGMYTAPSGAMIMSSGTYMDTITNSVGCDSIITINATINQPSTFAYSVTNCNSYTLPSGTVVTSTGQYMDTIPNAVGCDSVMTIDVTINMPTSSSISPTACSMYMSPSGMMLMSSGTYMDTIPNMMGCDSVITINLTVNMPSSSTINPVACYSYTSPGGMTITTSGTYMDTIPNMMGCDSVITINATINNATTASVTTAICSGDVYTAPSGAMYTASGTYMDTVANMAGCDSIITIALMVNTVDVSVTQNNPMLTAGATNATFQWINCSNNAPVAGATSQSFTPVANGNYAVIVTQNNCTDTSACFSVTGIGIEENALAGSVQMYPNPNQGQFNIDLGMVYSNVTVEIMDVTGRVVSTQTANGAQIIPVNLDAAAGVYTVVIRADDQKATMQLIKE